MECIRRVLWTCKALRAGEVGYICASIKQVADARVGDTITLDGDPTEEPLPGYKKVQPMVLLRDLSGRGREVRECQGRPGKAAGQ